MAHANTNTSLFPSRVVSKCKHPSRYSVCLECAASTAENFIPDSYAIAIFAGTLTNNRKNLWAQWARLGTVGTNGHSGHDCTQWARMGTVGTIGHSGHNWSPFLGVSFDMKFALWNFAFVFLSPRPQLVPVVLVIIFPEMFYIVHGTFGSITFNTACNSTR